MSLNQIQQSIKLSMNMINKALKQIPVDKRQLIGSRISVVLNKYLQKTSSQEELKKFEKELQFNLNFIKLSHPKLDYTQTNNQQINKKEEVKTKDNQEMENSDNEKSYNHKFKLFNNSQMELQRLNFQDDFDRQQEISNKINKYQRQIVEFSNWFQGNVDPEQLRIHKQLLERQYFQGQFWKGKEKPKSIARTYLESMMASQSPGQTPPKKDKVLQDFTPDINQSDDVWEKVKR